MDKWKVIDSDVCDDYGNEPHIGLGAYNSR